MTTTTPDAIANARHSGFAAACRQTTGAGIRNQVESAAVAALG